MNLDLFDTPPQPQANLLPYDGMVNDYGVIFAAPRADALLDALLRDIPWRYDEAVVFGRRITTARKVAWYGDGAFAYTYSGITRTALPWSGVLPEIKCMVEARLAAVSPTVFNSCLLNLYSDGLEGMAWHSDDEKELGRNTVIASVSFGATRKFAFKHKRTGEKRELMLEHGQLIVMRGETQSHWLHAVMRSTKIREPRINLTFRTILKMGMQRSG
ncbi:MULTISPECIES: alpha-ketoglutarate-dependent dioxygenase AlkB [unclassified Neisseria]|uniref:alpha-ketoglutarate-dependent dioxygenase AlkB family protein n=1 Tax=unclassified Neisseria TaxID=2623750 RepID=UPI00107263DE|nr:MULTISPECIES: alpha-ketoglutarate-dependent dioxygenase AlkB [unclassified Neisseria]MBF0803624.1 alpha-ketoglutarate-dependent dioxygenase AlkB [Neisseria sp. 19428wB4_WF04]TFU43705.1 alpha-ketoglutarate-dependent dioxygenase AlkB [Neisseria sp. WF04]